MKYQFITAGIAGCMMLCLQSNQTQAATMSGTYTIDQTVDQSTNSAYGVGARNFKSFSAAITALNNNGISGHVTFYVRPGTGTYTETQALQINVISPTITGGTVTIEGGGNTLQLTGSPTGNAAIYLNNADNIKIRSLVLDLTGVTKSPFFGVQISNGSSGTNVTTCQFKMPAASSSHLTVGIIVNDGSASIDSDPNAGSIDDTGLNAKFESNLIEDGNIGIQFGGYQYQSGQTNLNNIEGVEINSNQIHGAFAYGIRTRSLRGAKICRNSIILDTQITNNIGHEGTGLKLYSSSGDYEYTHNRIQNAGFIGVELDEVKFPNTYGNGGVFANNMIGGNFCSTVTENNYTNGTWGLAINQVNNLKVYNNTVNIHTSVSYNKDGTVTPIGRPTVVALMIYDTNATPNTGLDIQNNSFSYTGSGSGLAAYITRMQSFTTLNNNNYYSTSAGSGILIGYSNTDYGTISAFRTATPNFDLVHTSTAFDHDQASYTYNPNYVNSSTDLHLQPCPTGGQHLKDKGVTFSTEVPDDIDGDVRSGTYDLGADEVTGTCSGRMMNPGTETVPAGKSDLNLGVFPVPFQKEFTVSLTSLNAQPAQLTLTDVKGRIVYQRTVQLQAGDQQISVKPSADLAKGAYTLLVQQGSESSKITLIKE